MLSEHDIKRIQALFTLARRPIPKFVKVKTEKQSIQEKHGTDGRKLFLRDALARLYDKYLARGALTNFSEKDLRLFPLAVFQGAGCDRPALYVKFPNVVANLQKVILGREDPESLKSFVRAFCLSEAAVSCDALCRELVITVARQCPEYKHHIVEGLFNDQAWTMVARNMPEYAQTSDLLETQTQGLYKRNTPFAREVFRSRLPQLGNLLTRCVDEELDFSKAFEFIRREASRQNSSFIWPEYTTDFVDALLDPFSITAGRVPSMEFQDELLTLLSNFFGDPDDPVNDWCWKHISQRSKDTLQFWKVGRILFSALSMVREMTQHNFDANLNIESAILCRGRSERVTAP